jgi:hypothetical protein
VGGISDRYEMKLNDAFCFLQFDIKTNLWTFNYDVSIKDPIKKEQRLNPLALFVDKYFYLVQKDEDEFTVNIFEMISGGVYLKVKMDRPLR